MFNRMIWLPGLRLLALVGLAMAGCGGDGLDRYPLHGSVTYEGQPITFGTIFFEPTASVGTIAPTVYLGIRDGHYDAGSEGPIAGKYNVVIGAEDRSAKARVDSDGITHTPKLFEDYTFEVQIPPAGNRLDIEVPATQAIKPR